INATLLRARLRQLPRLPRLTLRVGTVLPVIIFLVAIIAKWKALTAFGNRPYNLSARLLSECRALCDYLFNILVPNLRGGGLYHDDFAISRSLVDPWTTLPSVLAIIIIVAGALIARRRFPLLSFAGLWFFSG